MNVEKTTIQSECFTNEEGTNRYYLSKNWGTKNQAIIAIITLKPASNNTLESDLTTMLIQNHVAQMGYHGFIALNLVSGIEGGNKVSAAQMEQEIENEVIKEALNKKEVQQIIIGCGSSITQKGFPQERLKEIISLISKTNQEKIVAIVDSHNKPIHPLVPSIRNQPWELRKIKLS